MDPTGQEINPYSYATCNPVNASDPTGTVTACAAFASASTIVGGVAALVSAALLWAIIISALLMLGTLTPVLVLRARQAAPAVVRVLTILGSLAAIAMIGSGIFLLVLYLQTH